MGTRTMLRLNHEQRILNSGARLHGAETTPLGGQAAHPTSSLQQLPCLRFCIAREYALRCDGRCSALRRQMQRIAEADAAHCVFSPIRPPFRPTPFHQSKDCSPLSYEMPNKLCTRPIRTPLIPHSETSGRTARRPIEHNARPTPVHSETLGQRIFPVGEDNIMSRVLSLRHETRPTAQSNPTRSSDRQLRH